MALPDVEAGGVGRAVVQRDIRVLELHGLDGEVLERDGVARGGVRLAELQADRQRAVVRGRGDEHIDMVGAACRQAAAVERTVGVLGIAVEANLVVGLIAGGVEVELDAVARVGLEGHAGGGVELRLPHAAVGRVGGSLHDRHRRARGVLREVDDVAVVMLLVDRIDAAVDLLAYLVRYDLNAGRYSCECGKLLPEADDRSYRGYDVDDHEQREDGDDDDFREVGNIVYDPEHCRMQHVESERARDAPVDVEPEADVAVEVELIFGVVPPPHVEGVVQDDACDEFHDGRRSCGTEEDDEEIPDEGIEQPYCSIEADAVHGAHGACEEASVDEPSLRYTVVDDFDYPADEAVDEEHRIGFEERIRQCHVLSALIMWYPPSVATFVQLPKSSVSFAFVDGAPCLRWSTTYRLPPFSSLAKDSS